VTTSPKEPSGPSSARAPYRAPVSRGRRDDPVQRRVDGDGDDRFQDGFEPVCVDATSAAWLPASGPGYAGPVPSSRPVVRSAGHRRSTSPEVFGVEPPPTERAAAAGRRNGRRMPCGPPERLSGTSPRRRRPRTGFVSTGRLPYPRGRPWRGSAGTTRP
jgi:hypothetical protein